LFEDGLEKRLEETIPTGGSGGKLPIQEDRRDSAVLQETEQIGPKFTLQRYIEVGL
jgi:hypothetical protein